MQFGDAVLSSRTGRRRAAGRARRRRRPRPDAQPRVRRAHAPPAPFVPVRAPLRAGGHADPRRFRRPGGARGSRRGGRERRCQPLFDVVTPMPYVALQQMLDEANAVGHPRLHEGPLPRRAARRGHRRARRPAAAAGARRMSEVLIFPFGGAIADVGDDDTAFGGSRSLRFVVAIEGIAAGRRDLRSRPAVGPRHLGRAAAGGRPRRRVRQPDGRVRGRQPRATPTVGEVRPAPEDQGAVRPDERVPAQRQHPARLRCDAGNERRFR